MEATRFGVDGIGGCVAVFFLCLYKLGKEAVNGVNTEVCGDSGAIGDWLERVKIKGGRRLSTWLWECVEKALNDGVKEGVG